jgi:phage terminase large subunit-like protein
MILDPDHIAHQYALRVISGEEISCKWIRLSCERYLQDLKDQELKGIFFNQRYADHAISFFHKFLRHSKGEFLGRPFILEPWQQFQLWQLFGWRSGGEHGLRRFRTSYLEVPRKNGKTTLAAGVLIYCTFADLEPVAEGYAAATKKDQARICYDEASRMIRQSPDLKKHLGILKNSIFYPKLEQKLQPLASDSDSMDGLNVHCGVIDELHAHKTADMVNVLRTATGSRRQPIIYEITTAGTNKQSICYNHHNYSREILQGDKNDDSWLAMIFTLDDQDEWADEKIWRKANPNLGGAKKIEYMRAQVKEAQNNAAYQSAVKRLDFNLWEGVQERWLPDKIWINSAADPQPTDQELRENFESVAGLDIASTRDFTALAVVFWNDSRIYAKLHTWNPSEMIDERVKKQNISFDAWSDQGWIRRTAGNIMDSDTITMEVAAYVEKYGIQSVAFDKYQAYSGLIQNLISLGVNLTEQPQGISYMSEPTKQIEKLLMGGILQTDGSPVMDWMMGNIFLYVDPNGNYKMNKGKSTEKIDGPVSLAMALAEMMHINGDISSQFDPLNEHIEF